MGHKVHPIGFRLGIAKDWNSKWFANKRDYADYLAADLKVREMLRKKLAQAGISKILIERPAKTARVTIHTARPGVVIGKRGEDILKLRKEVSALMGGETMLAGALALVGVIVSALSFCAFILAMRRAPEPIW